MFGLYMLAIYLGVAIIGAGFVALLVVVALAVGLVTHPIRTLALVFHKLAALAAGLALILALIVWFWYDHSKPDFVPCFWGSIGVIVASILIRTFAEWILERPTRAERRAMKRAAAQETGRVTMCMPVSEEVCISSSRCFVFSHVFFSGLGSCMHFPYFSGCAEVFLPNMRASL
ncbi:hypothetical protein, partial [Bifidobacterium longum]|uniref:hypothetical protein n=1 Tax=Bifidobacterium longum TaxID=216816 RepID=UPI0025570D3F